MSEETPEKPKPPLTFSEGLHFYFQARNELYEAKVKREKSEMIELEQRFADALLQSLMETAEKVGKAQELREAVAEEQRIEKHALWARMLANKLKAAKPSLLSLELLGSFGVVVALVYYVLQMDLWLALLSGVALGALRLSPPLIVERYANHWEQGLRRLRHSDELKSEAQSSPDR